MLIIVTLLNRQKYLKFEENKYFLSGSFNQLWKTIESVLSNLSLQLTDNIRGLEWAVFCNEKNGVNVNYYKKYTRVNNKMERGFINLDLVINNFNLEHTIILVYKKNTVFDELQKSATKYLNRRGRDLKDVIITSGLISENIETDVIVNF